MDRERIELADAVGEYHNRDGNPATLHVERKHNSTPCSNIVTNTDLELRFGKHNSTQWHLRTTCWCFMRSKCTCVDKALRRIEEHVRTGARTTSWHSLSENAQNVVPFPTLALGPGIGCGALQRSCNNARRSFPGGAVCNR